MNIDKTTYKALTNIDYKEAADKRLPIFRWSIFVALMLHLDTLLSVT